MKLSECKYGVIVINENNNHIGMVVGITNNACHFIDLQIRSELDRAIPLIQWSNGDKYPIHHENLSLYEN